MPSFYYMYKGFRGSQTVLFFAMIKLNYDRTFFRDNTLTITLPKGTELIIKPEDQRSLSNGHVYLETNTRPPIEVWVTEEELTRL